MVQYAKRKIDITFNLGLGTFGEDKGSDVTLSGHRVSLSLSLAGGASQPTAQFRIFGLPLSMMNQLTRIGPITGEFRVNNVLIAAGDDGGPMSVVHMGTIYTAFADFNAAPDVAFDVISRSGLVESMRPVNARSYKGATDAADVMSDLAAEMNVAFERNGVSVILQNPYFPGTALAQVQRCADAAHIDYTLDRGTLAVWSRNGSRMASSDIRIAADTGMIGYPAFTSGGVALRTLFNPAVVLGSKVQVESELTVANGRWNVYSVAHTLETEVPNGQWFTDILCQRALDE